MTKLSIPVSARDHVQGEVGAPLTLVQYGDYQCPSCGQAYPIVKAVQQKLGARLRFVFRNYPLPQHPHALHAAEVAEAAAVLGKFWEMHDTLYQHQAHLEDAHLLGYATQLGLDPGAVAKEASSVKVVNHIKADIAGGDASGVQGTPAFYINGESFEDSWDEATLLAVLEGALEP